MLAHKIGKLNKNLPDRKKKTGLTVGEYGLVNVYSRIFPEK
jgi:hypothetical protein